MHDQNKLGRFGSMRHPTARVLTSHLGSQMMYVSGETGEPSVETTGIIEDIVRQQVIEIVSGSVHRAPG